MIVRNGFIIPIEVTPLKFIEIATGIVWLLLIVQVDPEPLTIVVPGVIPTPDSVAPGATVPKLTVAIVSVVPLIVPVMVATNGFLIPPESLRYCAWPGAVGPNPVVAAGSIVVDTDRMANEMLFRILYGESEFINKKMLYVNNNILSKNDLIKYSDPSVQAKDIYDQILYNFDTRSVMTNLNLNGSFSIKGVAAVGKTIDINIGNINSSLTIVRENGKIYIKFKIDSRATSAYRRKNEKK